MPAVPDVRFLKDLANACFYVLIEEADVIFSGSTTSGPSRLVRVVRSFSGKELDQKIFDMQIDWVYWQEAVVPVLNDIRFDIAKPLNQYRVRLENRGTFIRDLEFALVESFRGKGFFPPASP